MAKVLSLDFVCVESGGGVVRLLQFNLTLIDVDHVLEQDRVGFKRIRTWRVRR
jgi:hypothetical protein